MSTTHIEQTMHLIVNLSADDRARLDKILEALTGLQQPNCHSCVETAVGMTKGLAELAEKAVAPNTMTEPEPVEQADAPTYTKDDIMAMVRTLAAPDNPKREQAKAIVKEYAAKVSAIPADKYTEVMDRLNELNNQGA